MSIVPERATADRIPQIQTIWTPEKISTVNSYVLREFGIFGKTAASIPRVKKQKIKYSVLKWCSPHIKVQGQANVFQANGYQIGAEVWVVFSRRRHGHNPERFAGGWGIAIHFVSAHEAKTSVYV